MAGRTYLSDVVNAEVQAQVADVVGARQWLLQGGLQGVPSEENALYMGRRLGVLRGTAPLKNLSGGVQREGPARTIPFVGASLGYGRIDLGGAWALQIEPEANVPIPPRAEGDDRPFPPPVSPSASFGTSIELPQEITSPGSFPHRNRPPRYWPSEL